MFVELPQGKDIILLVIENLSKFDFRSLVSLLVGLIIWSVISEFGARYKIYVTDNSGISLTDERVNFRKEAQRTISTIYLLLPVSIVILSVIIVSFINIKDWKLIIKWPFLIVVILLVLTFAFLTKFYLDDAYIARLRNSKAWFKVSYKELEWVNKLYSLYNDYILMVRKSNNYRDNDKTPNPDIKNTYNHFDDLIKTLPTNHNDPNSIEKFPRNYLEDSELPPTDFSDVSFREDAEAPDFADGNFSMIPNTDGYHRWIFKSNPSFFKTLHLQLYIIAISSLVFIILISTKFLINYKFIGSPALVCLSFGCWLGVYTGLFYIDSRYKYKIKISVRWLLVVWFFFVLFINHDRPVRNNKASGFPTDRMPLKDHFNAWLVMIILKLLYLPRPMVFPAINFQKISPSI